ncbi:MAG: hypothetical protein HY377_00760 [Candidatus Blackburnbacteria bacterium]|nr:hypothetical protein [Candidatus Blackburnbacteria bacterium]
MNRKLLVFLVVLLGIATSGGIFWFVKGVTQKPTTTASSQKEEVLRELPLAERPFASMTPRTDGHEFKLAVSRIPSGIDALEYELVYKNSDGVTQGVPGSVKLKGATILERNLLLGSCSSGKCKYDEGVEKGTLTLRLRNADGELIAKLETGFHLQQGGPLSSTDGNFKLTSSSLSVKTFYLTMGTFGLPGSSPGEVTAGPYGVFTSGKTSISGTVSLGNGQIYGWSGGKWTIAENGKITSLGVFVATK